jgi:hypothetical protein
MSITLFLPIFSLRDVAPWLEERNLDTYELRWVASGDQFFRSHWKVTAYLKD